MKKARNHNGHREEEETYLRVGSTDLKKKETWNIISKQAGKNVSVIESMFEDRDNEEWVSFSLASFS